MLKKKRLEKGQVDANHFVSNQIQGLSNPKTWRKSKESKQLRFACIFVVFVVFLCIFGDEDL